MPRALTKLFCYVVVALQVMTSAVFAQGVMLCVPAEGAAHIEDRAQQEKCAKEQQQRSSQDTGNERIGSVSDKNCVDIPVGGEGQTTVKVAQQAATQFDPAQFLAVIPQFLQITFIPFASTAIARTAVNEARMPDAMLESLGSVILVI